MADWAPPEAAEQPHGRNVYWMVAAAGIGLLALAVLVGFFTNVGDVARVNGGKNVAPYSFQTFGRIALGVGLALAALLQDGLRWGVRTALLLGAAFVFLGFGGIASSF